MSHLGAVEPQAAQAVEDLGLKEPYPAGVQLHDHGKGAVRAQDDVIDHRRVVADPHVVCSRDRLRSVVPNYGRP